MSPSRRDLLTWTAWALAGAAVLAWFGLVGFAWNDYDDEASRAVAALREGDVGRFLALSPAYGGSLVLRAPFALAPNLWGGGELAAYRMLAVPCLLAAVVFGVWLVGRMQALGRDRLTRGLALGLVVASPITLRALEIGHPEELLAGVLCVAAVLAAGGRRTLIAGILLGLAIATKAWALVAVGPVLLAMPTGRLKTAVVAAAVAAAVYAPFLTQPSAAVSAARTASQTGTIFQPWQATWFLGEHAGVVRSINEVKVGYRTPPSWLSPVSHPLIVLGAAALSLLWWRRRRGAPWHEALLLLALLLHLRCLVDPFNTVYYCLPFLLAILTWESLRTRRPQVIALGVTALAWLTFQVAPDTLTADQQSLLYLLWSVPLAAALAVRVFAPARPWPAGHKDDLAHGGLLPLRSLADQ